MATFSNNFGAKKGEKGQIEYYCEKCELKCFKKYSWERHLMTSKHNNATNSINYATPKGQKRAKYTCDNCSKEYTDRTGLWRHKKVCKVEKEQTDKEIIMMLIKENAEIKTMMKEQQTMVMKVIENGINSTTNNTHTNSHNKIFNLQLFLNETCKDAMNIMDFVDSIKLQLSDLENVGKVGYVEGISNIIVKNLKDLDVTERPIHCTDKKREVLYIKDENKWEKEDEERKKIRNVIKRVANKNIRLLQKFKEVHPDCGKSSSKFSDQYDKIIVEAMGGSGDNDLEKEEKIIQKISKNVTIDKEIIN
jgi:hypothetical protein